MDLSYILGGSYIPVVSAFLLGLITAIAPCPLATNIAAVAYISHKVGNRKYVTMTSTGLLARGALGRIFASRAQHLHVYQISSKLIHALTS